jgi:hypothetical protein
MSVVSSVVPCRPGSLLDSCPSRGDCPRPAAAARRHRDKRYAEVQEGATSQVAAVRVCT